MGSVLVFGLAACGNGQGDVAAVVNGEEIPMSEFNKMYESQKEQMLQSQQSASQSQQGGDSEEKDSESEASLSDDQKKQLKTSVLENVINVELILQDAEEQEITASEDKVKEQFNQMKEQSGEDKFKEILKENDLTEEDLKKNIEDNLVIQKYFEKNMDEAEVTEKELKEEYDKMKQQYEAMNKQSEQEMEIPKFEDSKEQLKSSVKKSKQQKQQQEIIDKLRENGEIEKKVEV